MRRLLFAAATLASLVTRAPRARAQIALPTFDARLEAQGALGASGEGRSYDADASASLALLGGAASARFESATHPGVDDLGTEAPGPYREASVAYTSFAPEIIDGSIHGRSAALCIGPSWAGAVVREPLDTGVALHLDVRALDAALGHYGVLHSGGLALRVFAEDGAPPLQLESLALDRHVLGGDGLTRLDLLRVTDVPLGHVSDQAGLFLDGSVSLDHGRWGSCAGCTVGGPEGSLALDARLGAGQLAIGAAHRLAAGTSPQAIVVEDGLWLDLDWRLRSFAEVTGRAFAQRARYPAMNQAVVPSEGLVASLAVPVVHDVKLGVLGATGWSPAFSPGPGIAPAMTSRPGFELLLSADLTWEHGARGPFLAPPNLDAPQ